MPDLSLATLEDIVQELRRRNVAFALYVSHVLSGNYRPKGDIESAGRERVYSDDFTSTNPAFVAGLFCDGMQLALNALAEATDANAVDAAAVEKLSHAAKMLKETIGIVATQGGGDADDDGEGWKNA